MQEQQIPPIYAGQAYIGIIGDDKGILHHVIQMAGDNDAAPWDDQMAWAESVGGDLPTRSELLVIWERNRDKMRTGPYWTRQEFDEMPGYAWYQYFFPGFQSYRIKSASLLAVAVRRIPIDQQ